MAEFTREEVIEISASAQKLVGGDLREVDLSHTNLTGSFLVDACFAGADLRYARLVRANLSGADLRGANLRGAKLRLANLTRAKYDSSTTWPDGYDPEMAGARLSGS